ncbi:hypothetical protein NLD30_10840 [SCandidatus Aminicenantes bacterium Aminicenantia_JdfR_composite]|jgi:hypothetical protein|nr:hypothetical protein [SCandidatus Aminicenantes bacterium Aminicenantia_JdfR_composite]MCP2598627.1 hypothetical protein [Candidatus Aminicenantes bacterium AC-335-L06]
MGEQEKVTTEEQKEIQEVEKAKETKEVKEAKEETPQPQQKKKKKINRMTLEEIEAQLQIVKEKMGGFDSVYAQHLLRRKEILLSKSKK